MASNGKNPAAGGSQALKKISQLRQRSQPNPTASGFQAAPGPIIQQHWPPPDGIDDWQHIGALHDTPEKLVEAFYRNYPEKAGRIALEAQANCGAP